MLYDWDTLTESQKVKAVDIELKKATRNATTKDDLVNMLRWLWDKFEVQSVEYCKWTCQDSNEGYYSGECGTTWTFLSHGPEHNEMKYCPGCGKPVKE